MSDRAQTVPPFIPGLVIVTVLIVISLLIGWRNYVRRMSPHIIPGLEAWEFYEGEVMEGGSRKPEKPKLWEVGVSGRAVSEETFNEGGWEKLMPLSAMSLNPESTTVGTPQTSPSLGSQTPTHAPSRFHRFKLFSSSAKAPPTTSLVPPPPDPLHRLQVSVLISMPSISSRIGPSRDSSASNPDRSEEQHTEDNHVTVEDEEEGAPDVAFGVVVLPWRKEEDDGEIGQTTISVI